MSAIVDKIPGSEVVGRVVVVDYRRSQVVVGFNEEGVPNLSFAEAKKLYSSYPNIEILMLASVHDTVVLTLADAKALRDSLDSMIGYLEAEEVCK